LNTDTCEMVFAFHESGTMRISRLEYQSVPEDGKLPSGAFIEVDGLYLVSAPQGGDGMDGIVGDPAHWAVCLFPRDAHGNVVGWFMEFDSRRDLINALGDGISTNAIMRLQ
jgi:hypothetical protein